MLQLLIHQWKEKRRSTFWQKNILLNIVLGILAFYVLLNIAVIGYMADEIIRQVYKNKDVVEVFTGFLFFYFVFDLLFRILMQPLPTLSIQPYLTLPIKKNSLLHYPLIKSIWSFFNLLALLLILPFFVKVIWATKPIAFSLAWIITVLALITINNFLVFTFKKYFYKRPVIMFLLLAITGAALYYDVTKAAICSGSFSAAILFILQKPVMGVVPVALSLLSYSLGFYLLKKNSYLEETESVHGRSNEKFMFLNRYGNVGSLIQTEIKMILRNKRPKSLLLISGMLLLYGFLFYNKTYMNNYFMLMFAGLLITSAFSMSYGQYMFSWESTFFDTFIANKISPFNFVKSKFLLLGVTNFIVYLLTLPYALISYKIGLINTAMVLYNTGITSTMLIYLCTYNTSSIDLGKSQFMNYQGMGAAQFLLIIPQLGFPSIIYLVFSYFGMPQNCFYVLAIIGIAGIIFNKVLLQILAKQFEKRKYKMAIGFRQK